MSVERLLQLMPAPSGIAVGNWEPVEQALPTGLPADYKEFVNRYGSGAVAEFLWVLSPFTTNPNLNLSDKGREMISGYEFLHRQHPREYPFETFPAEGGVLPWAVTDNGDELYWLTAGHPDQWPTVIYATSEGSFERHDMPMSVLLARWLSGTLDSSVLPESMPAVFLPE